ncbi:hypothetical protein KAR91_61765 [Candidatus Pacearchaeota archaeon]|nr:hypothetical protein [Candidatus Pacearchaeota archaeon]
MVEALLERRKEVAKAEGREAAYRELRSTMEDKYGAIVMLMKIGGLYYAYLEDAETCHRILGREYYDGHGVLSPAVVLGMEDEALKKSMTELFGAGYKVCVLGREEGCTVIAERESREAVTV